MRSKRKKGGTPGPLRVSAKRLRPFMRLALFTRSRFGRRRAIGPVRFAAKPFRRRLIRLLGGLKRGARSLVLFSAYFPSRKIRRISSSSPVRLGDCLMDSSTLSMEDITVV